MLSSTTVVLDVEGFRHRKEKFIVKELGVCTEDYHDCVSFLPPTSYSELTTQQNQSFSWLTKNLHGIEWDTGNYTYIYLTQIIQSVHLRNPGAIFYAKGEEKVKFLSDLLECSIIDLNSLTCPSTICALITGDGNLSLSISKDETIKTGNQFLQRKVKLLLTEDEIRSFTHLVYYIEPFLQWRKQNVKNSTQSLSSETFTDVEAPDW